MSVSCRLPRRRPWGAHPWLFACRKSWREKNDGTCLKFQAKAAVSGGARYTHPKGQALAASIVCFKPAMICAPHSGA